MKRTIWLGLAAVMLLSAPAIAQRSGGGGGGSGGGSGGGFDEEFEMQQRELDIQERKLKMAHEAQLRKLQLEKQKLGVKRGFGMHGQAAGMRGRAGMRGEAGMPAMRKAMMKRMREHDKYAKYDGRLKKWRYYGFKAFLAGAFVVNLLLAIWVFTDIRQRNAGSGIWIFVTLLAGCFGALLYVLVRLGDIRMAENHRAK